MANAIVVIVVIIIMLFAGKGAYKHLKGEGACCGGGSKPEIPKKKLDGTKLGEKTMKITCTVRTVWPASQERSTALTVRQQK